METQEQTVVDVEELINWINEKFEVRIGKFYGKEGVIGAKIKTVDLQRLVEQLKK